MAARPYQVRREQLTARQWADLCEFFEAVRGMAQRVGRKHVAADK